MKEDEYHSNKWETEVTLASGQRVSVEVHSLTALMERYSYHTPKNTQEETRK